MVKRVATTKKVKNLGIKEAVVHIRSTGNNIILSMADQKGNVLKQDSAGVTFKGSRKSTPHAANVVAERMANWGLDRGIESVSVLLRGFGIGREMSVKTLNNVGMQVTAIKDRTGVPHGGCRPRKKPRK